MRKNVKRAQAIAVAAVMAVCAIGTSAPYNTKASEIIYDDSNISLEKAFDRYIATGSGELAEQLQMVVNEELAMQATSSDAEYEVTGSITSVDLSETGEIVAVETTEEVAEESTEATTEAVAETTTEVAVPEAQPEEKPQPAANNSEFAGKAIIVTTGVVNIRSGATASSDKVGTIKTGGVVTVESKGGEWSEITSGDIRGYIKNEFMAFDDAAARYAADHANLVAYDSAQVYVAPDPTTEATTAASSDEPQIEMQENDVITTATAGYQPVVDYALQFVGNPYVYGGSSLTNGTDCSGFTMSCYANFGYSLPHSSAVQATRGTEVDLSAISPGDLLFYKNGGKTIGHVALYIGNGQIVHASTSKTGIIVSNMNYGCSPCKAVRIVN